MHKGLSHFSSLVQTAFELLDLSTLTSKASQTLTVQSKNTTCNSETFIFPFIDADLLVF